MKVKLSSTNQKQILNKFHTDDFCLLDNLRMKRKQKRTDEQS